MLRHSLKFFINSEAALNQGANFSDSSCFSQMIIRTELDGKRLFKLFSEFILSKTLHTVSLIEVNFLSTILIMCGILKEVLEFIKIT